MDCPKRYRLKGSDYVCARAHDGILEYEEESGKGGYHRVYFPKMNKEKFAKHVKKTITAKLLEVFP